MNRLAKAGILVVTAALCTSVGCSSTPNDPGAGGTSGGAGTKGGTGKGGTVGTAGASGTAGATGTAGASGTAGAIGTAGATGTAGIGGIGGASAISGAAGIGGAAGSGGTGVSAAYLALENAELATAYDPTLLTYTSIEDSNGDETAVGWGPNTLPSAAQRTAATALVRAIVALLPNSVRNSTNTANAVPGVTSNVPNPLNGLLTLGADPASLISGTDLAASGTALEAFRTAVISDASAPTGVGLAPGLSSTAGASNANLGAYLAQWAVDPSSAVGIADNIVIAAIEYNLVAQLTAF
jgi:hypothetical protein